MVGIIDRIYSHCLQVELLRIKDMVEAKTEFLINERESHTSTTSPPGIIQSVAMIRMNVVAAAILNRTHTSGATQIIEIATDNKRIMAITQRICNRL